MTRTVGIGVLLGSIGFGFFTLRTPPDSPDAHPLPSATAEYTTHKKSSRYLPWLGSRELTAVSERDLDKSDWLPATVRVVDLDGRPVANAAVEVRIDARAHALANLSVEEYDDLVAAEEAGNVRLAEQPMLVVDRGETDRDGLFKTTVAPNITASAIVRDRDAQEGVSATFVTVQGAESAPEVVVEVAPLAVFMGRIEDGDGNPVADAALGVTLRGSAALQTDVIDAPEGVRTLADGTFRVPVRGGGAIDLAINATGYQPFSLAGVQVLPGRETHRDLTLARAAKISGRLADANGNPVTGRIELHALEEVPPMSTYRHVPVQPDGSFFVADIAPSRYRLVAYGDGFPAILRESVEPDGAPIDVRFDAGGNVRGEVVVPLSVFQRLAPGVTEGFWGMVWITPEDPTAGYPLPLPSSSLSFDATGRSTFEMAAVPAGRWTLRAQIMNVATIDRQIDVRRAADSLATIVFDDSGAATLAGHVRSARGAVRAGSMYLQSLSGGQSVSASIAENGSYEFPWVARGKYSLYATAYAEGQYESASREIEITGNTTFDLDTDPPVAVTIIDGPPPVEEEWSEPFLPELDVEWSGDAIIVGVTTTVDGVRIWAGDRVTSIDGVSSDESGSSMGRLQGKEGSICRITLERPATGERFSFDMPRTRPQPRYGCRLIRGEW